MGGFPRELLGPCLEAASITSGSGDSLSRRSLFAPLRVEAASVLFAPESCPESLGLSWLVSPPALTKAVDEDVMALSPISALMGPGKVFPSVEAPRQLQVTLEDAEGARPGG